MSYTFQNVSVLVVEDNKPLLEITKHLLMTFGISKVWTAEDGEAGFQLFSKNNPDFIVTDWMMEPVDGLSLTRRIRSDALSPNPLVPIILMTGFTDKSRVIEARDAGITEFLVKPFNARDLYRRISHLIELPRQFVRTGEYFGPDRRRLREQLYSGPERREESNDDDAV